MRPPRMRSLLKSLVLTLALIMMLSAGTALADELYGKIRGTVTDSTGAVVVGATISATNIATGIGAQTASRADGSYEFLQLAAPATYTVTVQQPGFREFSAQHVALALNQIYVLDVQLEVGAVTQTVTVEAAPAQVESTSMQLGANLTSRDVTELPLIGRDWFELQQTLPGTVSTSDRFGGDYAANGTRAQFNSYMVNGTDANDFPLNLVSFVPSPDAVGEVNIITNTINPEY